MSIEELWKKSMLSTWLVEEASVVLVPTMCEFTDVFPDNLPSLPLNREIEFRIDILLGTVPISKAPCRIAPKEL